MSNEQLFYDEEEKKSMTAIQYMDLLNKRLTFAAYMRKILEKDIENLKKELIIQNKANGKLRRRNIKLTKEIVSEIREIIAPDL